MGRRRKKAVGVEEMHQVGELVVLPSPSESGKATDADVVVRRRFVADRMAAGASAEVAARELAEGCEISIVAARIYVRDVREEWAAMEVQQRPQRRAAVLATLETIVDRALNACDFQAAIKALAEISRITGLYQPDKLEVVSVQVRMSFEERLASMPPEQRTQLRAILEAQRAKDRERPAH